MGAELSLFISYRKSDVESAARALYERLVTLLGADRIFLEGEPSHGSRFVLLVLIGPRWLEALHHDPRFGEIADALRNPDAWVVPVLVAEAAMPSPHQLPPALRGLAERQAVRLRLEAFEEDVQRLIEDIRGGTRWSVPVPPTAPSASPTAPPSGGPTPLAVDELAALRGEDVVSDFDRVPDIAEIPVAAEPIAPVDCTVFAPPAVAAGESALVQVFVHGASHDEIVRSRASEFDPAAVRRAVRSLAAYIETGARLTFELGMPGARVDDPAQLLTWNGRPDSVQFGIYVPRECAAKTLIGTVRVAQDGVPLGQIKFTLAIRSERRPEQLAPVGEDRHRYTLAFVSYASEDRPRVLARLQSFDVTGLQYFKDVLDLKPGERWERELYRHIDEADVFLLSWSTAAYESEWVRREANYALERSRDDPDGYPVIWPMIIEGPPVLEPWPELSGLHFNDPLIYVMRPGVPLRARLRRLRVRLGHQAPASIASDEA
jgi:hypothetical protein